MAWAVPATLQGSANGADFRVAAAQPLLHGTCMHGPSVLRKILRRVTRVEIREVNCKRSQTTVVTRTYIFNKWC